MREIVIDSFAGGGGASTGIEAALGRAVDVAINHDADAIRMHEANHPDTLHLNSNIYHVDPRDVRPGEPIGLMWASPDCTHHSKAKGGVPLRNEGRNSRDLAWVIVDWAQRRQPRVIIMENVEEWKHWGPVVLDEATGNWVACPERRGQHYRDWCKAMRKAGYRLDSRELRACDYGAPTLRKRLFLIARRDGEPIVWPEPTHGAPDDPDVVAGRKQPWRTAAEIIDWTLACPSIFMDQGEVLEWTQTTGLRVKRPLASNTLARIAKGVKRYVLDAAEPFIATLNHGGEHQRGWALDEPFRTITAARDAHALIAPVLTYAQQGGGARSVEQPHHTITASSKDQNAVIVPHLVPRYGERQGQEPRTRSLEEPLATVVGTGNGSSLVAPFLAQHNTGVVGHDAREPVSTITTRGTQQNVAAVHLQKYYGTDQAPELDEPMCTMTTRDRGAIVAAHMMPHYGASVSRGADEPVGSLTAGGQGKQGLVAAHMVNMKGSKRSSRACTEPVTTQTTQSSHAGVIAALAAAPPFSPEHEARARQVADLLRAHGYWDEREFVTVEIGGESFVLVDIGMRMLSPREQFRAQGFPDSYEIEVDAEGKPFTKTTMVSCCGNSVSPPVARALVRANYTPCEVARPPQSAPHAFRLEAAE